MTFFDEESKMDSVDLEISPRFLFFIFLFYIYIYIYIYLFIYFYESKT
jgi:hypothetical protein